MASDGLPLGLAQRSDDEDVRRDVESARGTTMADRARILEALCRMAAELISQQPDPRRALDWKDPLPAESERILERLRERTRVARSG